MSLEGVAVVLAYVSLVALPHFARKHRATRDKPYGSFVVGARDYGWFRIVAGLSATFVGGAAVLNLASLGYSYGWYALADVLPTSTALVLSALLIVPLVKRRKAISVGTFLGSSSHGLTLASGLLSAVIYTLISAAQIVALRQMLSPYVPVPADVLAVLATAGVAAYIVYGGYASVTFTDVVQFVLMFLAYFMLVGLSLLALPGEPAAAPIPSQVMPLDLIVLLGLPLLFVPVSQDLHIRVHSSRSERDGRGGVAVAGIVYLVFGLVSILVGRYLAHTGVALASPDDAVPEFLRMALGSFAILPTIAILAIVLSTLDSTLFAATTALAYEVAVPFRRTEPETDSALPKVAALAVLGAALYLALLAPRILTLIASALVLYVAVLFPLLGGKAAGVSERALTAVGISALIVIAGLEAAGVLIPFRVFVYAGLHALAIAVVGITLKSRQRKNV